MPSISVAGDTNVHGGAPFDAGLSTDVLAGGKGIALTGQTTSNENDNLYNQNSQAHPQGVSGNQLAVGGSGSVFINGKPIHRVGDARIDGATSGPGLGSCQVG